jgi:hypothetical protein
VGAIVLVACDSNTRSRFPPVLPSPIVLPEPPPPPAPADEREVVLGEEVRDDIASPTTCQDSGFTVPCRHCVQTTPSAGDLVATVSYHL